MEKLTQKIKSQSTEMLIEVFTNLASVNTDEANIVNDVLMSELEERMSEEEFCKLLDEVYED